jgi:protein-disulfide isomerase
MRGIRSLRIAQSRYAKPSGDDGSSALHITRRSLLDRATLLALLASAPVLAERSGLSIAGIARAQTAAAPESTPDLMTAGPLPDRILGPTAATVTIVEYSSMTCSHCVMFANTTFPALKKELIETGKVRFIARPLPIDALSAAASMLLYSVPADRYYEVMEALFSQEKQWLSDRIQPLMTFAVEHLGFTEQSFAASLTDKQLLDNLAAERENANKLGATSTPTFFVNDSKTKIVGYRTVREMEDLIKPHLKV